MKNNYDEYEVKAGISFRTFLTYPPEKQEYLIRNWVDLATQGGTKEGLENIMLKGHSDELHCQVTEEDLLLRTLKECRPTSTFASWEDATIAANEMIYYYAREIADWLTNPERRREQKFVTNAVVLDKQSSYGIGMDFKKRSTDICRIVLERDISVQLKFFFYVKTIFPEIRYGNDRQEVEKDLSNTAKEMLTTRSDIPHLSKTFWALKINGYDVDKKTEYVNGYINEYIYVNFNIGKHKCAIYFNEDSHLYRNPFVKVQDEKGRWISIKKRNDISLDEKSAIMIVANKINHINSIVAGQSPQALRNVFKVNENPQNSQDENSKNSRNENRKNTDHGIDF